MSRIVTEKPWDFVSLSESLPEVILESRYYTTFNFIGDRIEGYESPCAYLTIPAATALKGVCEQAMALGFRLKVYDAYRPQRAVAHFMRWSKDLTDLRMKRFFYPDLTKPQIIIEGYIMEKSGHSRGSTVDLTFFDMESGKELDMGGTFDFFGKESHPDYEGVTSEQHNNRMLLRKLMTRHGFKGIDNEWWHFTLIDEPYPDTYFDFPVK